MDIDLGRGDDAPCEEEEEEIDLLENGCAVSCFA